MPMVIEHLRLWDWKQFGVIDLDFHPDVTIITGVNGAGKTTLLKVLALALTGAPPFHQAMTSAINPSTGAREFIAPVRVKESDPLGGSEVFRIGMIKLANGRYRDVNAAVPHQRSSVSQYEILGHHRNKPEPDTTCVGVFVSSHRAPFVPEMVSSVSNETTDWWQVNPFQEPVLQAMFGLMRESSSERSTGNGTNFGIKRALMSWAVYGFGNEAVIPEPRLRTYFSAFDKLLADLLPEAIGYKRILVRGMDVVVETQRGEFPFDALSGGMASIVEIAWLLLNRDFTRERPIAVIIDEPENHLHAAMQRELLPRLRKAFPNAQFIVSTHSPLIASSVRDAYVYALRHDEDGYVENVRLDLDDWAGTASDVLRDVLGLDATIPVWAEERLRSIAGQLSEATASPELVNSVYQELREDGLEEFAPRLVAGIGRQGPIVE